MTISFSRRLAIIFGVLAPLAETIRRWNQLSQLSVWPFWLDDYIMGAFLLYGAWQTKKDIRNGTGTIEIEIENPLPARAEASSNVAEEPPASPTGASG